MFHQTIAGSDAKTDYLFDLLGVLQKSLGPTLTPTRWSTIQETELAGSTFVDLNELDFYYSDSFVIHHFLSRGSRPFEHAGEPAFTPEFIVPASFHHAYGVSRHAPSGADSAELQARMGRFLDSPLFCEEERAFEPKDSFERGDKYGARSFEAMIYALARETLPS
jgi:hypothetical protein